MNIKTTLTRASLHLALWLTIGCGAGPEGKPGPSGATGEAGLSISAIYDYSVVGAATDSIPKSGGYFVTWAEIVRFSDGTAHVAVAFLANDNIRFEFYLPSLAQEQTRTFVGYSESSSEHVFRFRADTRAEPPTLKLTTGTQVPGATVVVDFSAGTEVSIPLAKQ